MTTRHSGLGSFFVRRYWRALAAPMRAIHQYAPTRQRDEQAERTPSCMQVSRRHRRQTHRTIASSKTLARASTTERITHADLLQGLRDRECSRTCSAKPIHLHGHVIGRTNFEADHAHARARRATHMQRAETILHAPHTARTTAARACHVLKLR